VFEQQEINDNITKPRFNKIRPLGREGPKTINLPNCLIKLTCVD